MPSTVERPQAVNAVTHATEYGPDRESRGQGDSHENGNESDAQRHPDETGSVAETPAVLVDAHHHEDHLLDGVAAYRAAAHHVSDAQTKTAMLTSEGGNQETCAAETVRHAYEDHGGEIEHHSVNVAT